MCCWEGWNPVVAGVRVQVVLVACVVCIGGGRALRRFTTVQATVQGAHTEVVALR